MKRLVLIAGMMIVMACATTATGHHKLGHQNGWGFVSCMEAQELREIGTDILAAVAQHQGNIKSKAAWDFLNWITDRTADMVYRMDDTIVAKCKAT